MQDLSARMTTYKLERKDANGRNIYGPVECSSFVGVYFSVYTAGDISDVQIAVHESDAGEEWSVVPGNMIITRKVGNDSHYLVVSYIGGKKFIQLETTPACEVSVMFSRDAIPADSEGGIGGVGDDSSTAPGLPPSGGGGDGYDHAALEKAIEELAIIANSAINIAGGAAEKADSATATADDASKTAGTALSTAEEALELSKSTQGFLENVQNEAIDAKALARAASQDAAASLESAKNAEQKVTELGATVSTMREEVGAAIKDSEEAKSLATSASYEAAAAQEAATNVGANLEEHIKEANLKFTELDAAITEAKDTADRAVTVVDDALTAVDGAIETANEAISQSNLNKLEIDKNTTAIEEATKTANDALEQAGNAETMAEEATKAAEEAKTAATNAETLAKAANVTADAANAAIESLTTSFEDVETMAGEAKSAAENAVTQVEEVKSELANIKLEVAGFEESIKSAQDDAAKAVETVGTLETKLNAFDEKIDSTKELADSAVATAGEAKDTAGTALAAANAAQESVKAVDEKADAAQETANEATKSAAQALTVAASAQQSAGEASDLAANAHSAANAAYCTAQAFQEQIAKAVSTAEDAHGMAEAASSSAAIAQELAESATKKADEAQASVDAVTELVGGVQSEVEAVNTQITALDGEITAIRDDLSKKANADEYVPLAGATMTGALKVPTPDAEADETQAVNIKWVKENAVTGDGSGGTTPSVDNLKWVKRVDGDVPTDRAEIDAVVSDMHVGGLINFTQGDFKTLVLTPPPPCPWWPSAPDNPEGPDATEVLNVDYTISHSDMVPDTNYNIPLRDLAPYIKKFTVQSAASFEIQKDDPDDIVLIACKNSNLSYESCKLMLDGIKIYSSESSIPSGDLKEEFALPSKNIAKAIATSSLDNTNKTLKSFVIQPLTKNKKLLFEANSVSNYNVLILDKNLFVKNITSIYNILPFIKILPVYNTSSGPTSGLICDTIGWDGLLAIGASSFASGYYFTFTNHESGSYIKYTSASPYCFSFLNSERYYLCIGRISLEGMILQFSPSITGYIGEQQ